jgi:hypothetical protein
MIELARQVATVQQVDVSLLAADYGQMRRHECDPAGAEIDVHRGGRAVIEWRIRPAQRELFRFVREREHGLRPVVRPVDEAREIAARDDEHVAICIDGRSARPPDAAGSTMRSCNGCKRARHSRCACIDCDEHARGGVAEGHIQLRAVRAQVQRATLIPAAGTSIRAVQAIAFKIILRTVAWSNAAR